MARKHTLIFLTFLFIINAVSVMTTNALWGLRGGYYYGRPYWGGPYYYGPYYDRYYGPSGGEVAAGAIIGGIGTAIAASERRKDREAYLEGRRRDRRDREENRRLREENRRLRERRRSFDDDDYRPRKYRRTMRTQTESTEPETSETD